MTPTEFDPLLKQLTHGLDERMRKALERKGKVLERTRAAEHQGTLPARPRRSWTRGQGAVRKIGRDWYIR